MATRLKEINMEMTGHKAGKLTTSNRPIEAGQIISEICRLCRLAKTVN